MEGHIRINENLIRKTLENHANLHPENTVFINKIIIYILKFSKRKHITETCL
jgi:hypothetical protein